MKLPRFTRKAETQPVKKVWEVVLNPRPLLYYGEGFTKSEAVEHAWNQFELELEDECSSLNSAGFEYHDAEQVECYPSGASVNKRCAINIAYYTKTILKNSIYAFKSKLYRIRQKAVKLATMELNTYENGNKIALGLLIFIETLLVVALGGML